MLKMFSRKKDKTSNLTDPITRPDSPKVTREKKSTDFDPSSVRSPVTTRKQRGGEISMHKTIYDLNTGNWQLRYRIDDDEYAKGAYGKVLLATDKTTGHKVVIKKIPQSTPIRMVNNEVKAGKTISPHPNIPQMYQYIDRPDYHFLVFQYVAGEDLFCYLEKTGFSPRSYSEARSIMVQICDALKHIHNHNIAHRDIKLENLLIDETGKVTVIDLGLCSFMEEGKLCRDWCGSDNYLAPEIVRRSPYSGYKADVFSAGVVLFALTFGVFPFENLRVNGASADPHRSLRRLQVRFPTDVKASESVKDLLSKMLEDDPDKRISMEGVLNHPWMALESASTSTSPRLPPLKSSCESGPVAAP
eukprot:TRINITY_DN5754_c0_g1_i2.p1 TRINITY_DN5754_c0_g1~~TRINITY_DN5754_c0_g1_i2.p1  ORF type:complete len:359 (-),score=90.95 TRINITY_DN5754_c0_g1_i2:131-1207(-)